MKKISITILLFGAWALAGCNKWLDVQPQGQTTKDELFQSQKGFRDALTGVYIDLKNGDAYGNALMWGNIEFLARNWDVISSSNQTLTNLVNANYTDAGVRSRMDNTYAKLYKIVADANSILEKIDAKRSIFQDDNYALVKGEALALRAFAHFDVLRMYGPMPDNPGSDPILPYVKAVSSDIIIPSSFADFAKQVLEDLDQAEALLKDVDPITQYSLTELNPSSSTSVPVVSDDYYMYRQLRMNYYAVLALKARVYSWLVPQGDANRVNAAKYAQMVIDAKDHAGQPTFRLGQLADATSGDYTMSSEHIAALSIYNLGDIANAQFDERGELARYDFNYQDGYYYLNNLFPVAERTADARWVNMWSYKTTPGQTSYVKYRKFIQKANQPILQAPLLRLSEMYLILTECAQTKEEAESHYGFYCDKKGIPVSARTFNPSNWQADRRNKILREYVREFYAEGQTFFTYKRYNVTSLPASWISAYYTATSARYIVPKPDREINYLNK